MNYKKIIKKREFRLVLLSYFSWVPDGIMLRLQYWIQTGRNLNLTNPKRFTEKLQLYKMKYRNPDMHRCTDKYEVRKYVEEKGLGECLIPLIGIFDNIENIDYSKLPDKFVAKTTDGGGGNQVFICKDKSILNESLFKNRLGGWMSIRKGNKHIAREWAYENNFPRRIIIENLIESENINEDLYQYNFFCFNGKVSYIYGLSDVKVGESLKVGIYDSDFKKLNVSRKDKDSQDVPLRKPLNFEKMIMIAECLSRDFPHVRVDLYNIHGKIFFSELTFYSSSGYMTFSPDSFDEEMGRNFDISSFINI